MKLIEFTTYLHNELQDMIFPTCSKMEQFVVGMLLSGMDFKLGQLYAKNEQALKDFGIVGKNGDLDLDCIEASVVNGIKFPVQLGPFTFNKEDVQKIIGNIKLRVPRIPEKTVIKDAEVVE